MIRQTKQQFEKLLQRHGIYFDEFCVLIATLHLSPLTTKIGNVPESSNKFDVILYKKDDFDYTDVVLTHKPYLSLLDNNYIEIDGNNNVMCDVRQLSGNEGDFVAIYRTRGYGFNGLFDNNVSVVSIDYINDNVTNIDFQYQSSTLKEINLADGRTTLYGHFYNSDLSHDNQLYAGNSNKAPYSKNSFRGKKLVLPYSDNLTYSIPDDCFADNTELLEVVIPRSCVGIGAGAFKGCTNLRHIFISNSVTTIGDGAFDGCVYSDIVNDDTINFEVESGNTKFVGLMGCLLEKNQDKSYSILHATSSFFNPNSQHYFANCKICADSANASDLPFYSLQTYPWAGMYAKSGGNQKLYDTQGNVITTQGKYISTYDSSAIIGNNYAIPIYFLIKEIKANACAGDTNMLRLVLADWVTDSFVPGLYFLRTIGNGAFNGCNISLLTLLKQDSIYTGCKCWWLSNNTPHELSIGESAFENCTQLGSLNLYFDCYIGRKAFFNCTSLVSVHNESKSFISDTTLGPTGLNVYSSDPTKNRVGELCFGNTPNLMTITGHNVYENVIISNDSDIAWPLEEDLYDGLALVGCNGSYLKRFTKVGEGAFYGSRYNGTNDADIFGGSILKVGQIAFYGDEAITTLSCDYPTHIYAKAFAGCSNLATVDLSHSNGLLYIYSQAFAKSGVTTITSNNNNYNNIALQSTDIFEDCTITSVTITGSPYTTCPHPVKSSSAIENAFMTIYPSSNNQITLIKGGNESKTVDSWSISDGNLTEIKSKAFEGVPTIVDNNTSRVTIPNTVTRIGSSIFNNSTIGNDTTITKELRLDSDVGMHENCVINHNRSIALLLKIGYKYFANILLNAGVPASPNYHYYHLDIINTNNTKSISLNEVISGMANTIWTIKYDSSYNIVMECYAMVNYDYANKDSNSHITTIPQEGGHTISFTLMYHEQVLSTHKEGILLSDDIVPGQYWSYGDGLNYRFFVPNDLEHNNKLALLQPLTECSNAFSNTNWANTLTLGRNLQGMEGGFKNCTNLTTVNGFGFTSTNDYSVFNGIMPESIFEGCSNFNGTLGNLGYDIPIVYEKDSFKGSGFTNPDNMLLGATHFYDGCFSDTNISELKIAGIERLNDTAFNGNNLSSAVTFGYSGYYFTGGDNSSICNELNYIVVGTYNTNLNRYAGVGENAFKNSKFLYAVQLENKNGYVIEGNAFSGSKITSFTETSCSETIIGNSAFESCNMLTTVSLGHGALLSTGSFKNCTLLSSVNTDAKIIPEQCFSGCVSLRSFRTNANILDEAFSGCSSLRSLELIYSSYDTPVIKPSAFKNCPLMQLKTDSTIAEISKYYIGKYVIYELESNGDVTILLGTSNFSDISTNNFKGIIKNIGDYAYCGRGIRGEVVIPDSVTYIGDYAFADNPLIESVYIPSTVKYIGDHAFDGCTNIDYFTLPDSCTYFGEGALKGCNLTKGFNCNALDSQYSKYEVPQYQYSVDTVHSFDGVLDLTNTQIFNEISNTAFYSTHISVVRLPKTCTSVGYMTFKDCTRLVELEINSDIALGSGSFYGCVNLKDIWLGPSVTLAPVVNQQDVLYGVGSYVSIGSKILHAPQTLNNNTFKSSNFYTILTGSMGFIVDWYTV